MLKFLHLEDYRCFKDTKLEFKDLTIAVGKIMQENLLLLKH